MLLAFYVALADKLGIPRDRLRGTCQNDILKEYHAQNEFVFPPRPALKLGLKLGQQLGELGSDSSSGRPVPQLCQHFASGCCQMNASSILQLQPRRLRELLRNLPR